MNSSTVLVTVTGRDRAGIAAALFAALAGHSVDVLDVEQVSIRERLILTVLLAQYGGDYGALRDAVASFAQALHLDSEVELLASGVPQAEPEAPEPAFPDGGTLPVKGWAEDHGQASTVMQVIVIGRPLRADAIGEVSGRIAGVNANIEAITQLATKPACALQLSVRTTAPAVLRAMLVQAAEDLGVDIAVEPAGLRRRASRLVVMDVDSTLIREEGIDVLAQRAGVGPQVAQVTARAMAGELDFTDSLHARVALLAGMSLAEAEAVRDEVRLTRGARTFVRTLKRLGYRVGVVSGGFTLFTDRFCNELGLDFAAANELEVIDGRLTGRVTGEVIDRAGKANALRRFAARYQVPLEQTVAIGDGANDIDMLEAAGLGIAFNGKAALRAAADTSVNLPYLDTVLFMLGISAEEIAEAAEVAEYA